MNGVAPIIRPHVKRQESSPAQGSLLAGRGSGWDTRSSRTKAIDLFPAGLAPADGSTAQAQSLILRPEESKIAHGTSTAPPLMSTQLMANNPTSASEDLTAARRALLRRSFPRSIFHDASSGFRAPQ